MLNCKSQKALWVTSTWLYGLHLVLPSQTDGCMVERCSQAVGGETTNKEMIRKEWRRSKA